MQVGPGSDVVNLVMCFLVSEGLPNQHQNLLSKLFQPKLDLRERENNVERMGDSKRLGEMVSRPVLTRPSAGGPYSVRPVKGPGMI